MLDMKLHTPNTVEYYYNGQQITENEMFALIQLGYLDGITQKVVAQTEIPIATELESADLLTDLRRDGFVNLHTNNSENGQGDGLWYPLTSNKVQHAGDPSMTMVDAVIAGIEIGETS